MRCASVCAGKVLVGTAFVYNGSEAEGEVTDLILVAYVSKLLPTSMGRCLYRGVTPC